ncbi:MAG TPA: 4a-hydroxytetrahydrobiopterin dehydratase [Actinomycetota bacterium]|nr:4a-hydroxytetrahydrobiopterin dehydratase [Actinomycetota bacterium]
MSLVDEHPQEYPKGTSPLSRDEAGQLSNDVPGWKIEDSKLVRSFEFKDFKEAFAFIARVALLVEEEGHHPDISNSWNKVRLSFWTHTAEGLTRNDFIMAAKVDTFAPD